ncbi:MAG: M23 family metallopeptidase [Pseudoxanthomonas sp.]
MSLHTIIHNSRAWTSHQLEVNAIRARRFSHARPLACAGILLGAGLLLGLAGRSAFGMVQVGYLQHRVATQQAELDKARAGAQQEINAMSARLGELQAQANRLNALGERLTRMGKLDDGEFDFDEPVGVGGGDAPTYDIAPRALDQGMGQMQRQLDSSGRQLSVLESLLFNRQLDRNATPSRMPLADTYVTSGFGGRADPFGGGGEFHKGMDFHANVGDPVLAVADGVVVFAGQKSGYGNVVDVDHGNGYMTRYAHNSRLSVREGDLVRAGQEVAKAGSSGRSTGAHVHLEVWLNGQVVNPRKFLGDGPTPVGPAPVRHG